MFKISAIDKIKWSKKALPVIKRIISSKKEQDKIISLLKENDYPELAEVAEDFVSKYGDQAKKLVS